MFVCVWVNIVHKHNFIINMWTLLFTCNNKRIPTVNCAANENLKMFSTFERSRHFDPYTHTHTHWLTLDRMFLMCRVCMFITMFISLICAQFVWKQFRKWSLDPFLLLHKDEMCNYVLILTWAFTSYRNANQFACLEFSYYQCSAQPHFVR